MDLPHAKIEKPFHQWQLVGLIILVLAALGFGQAVKTRVNNFPTIPPNASSTPEIEPSLATTSLKLGNQEFVVELAVTPEEKERGLSGRAALAPRAGLLFVWSDPQIPSFWMKDMNFPIDIIWLNAEQKIVGINKHVAPNTFPKTFSPSGPVQFVLEVNAGASDENNLKIGDLIHFSTPETL